MCVYSASRAVVQDEGIGNRQIWVEIEDARVGNECDRFKRSPAITEMLSRFSYSSFSGYLSTQQQKAKCQTFSFQPVSVHLPVHRPEEAAEVEVVVRHRRSKLLRGRRLPRRRR